MIYLCTCLPLWMFGRMKVWILSKLSRRLSHIYPMKFAFVSHSGARLRILMSFSTAVLGFLSCKMYFYCSPLSVQKISFTWPFLLRKFFDNFGDTEECPFCTVKLTAFWYPPVYQAVPSASLHCKNYIKQCLGMTTLCLASIKIACGLHADV